MTSAVTPTAAPVVSPLDSADVARQKVGAWLDATLPRVGSDGDELEWRDELYRAGLATPGWSVELGGLGLSEECVRAVNAELLARRAPMPYNLVTVHMVGEVLMTLGTREQQRRFLPPLASRQTVWCQLFSEVGAGSDLASLACRAEHHDDSWIINGQKVWSSFAAEAARGLLLARTDSSLPKQQGITAFAVDMRTPGVLVRPLRQLTGDAQFCEVFFDDVVVPDDDRIGEPNGGWTAANIMLSAERNMLGGPGASPVARIGGVDVTRLLDLLPTAHPGLRDTVLRFMVRERVIALLGSHLQHRPSHAALVKLAQAEHNQLLQALATNVVGPSAIAHEGSDELAAALAWGFLRSRANTIGGGTSEVMRNVIAERLLGLPREPDPYLGKPWAEIPRS